MIKRLLILCFLTLSPFLLRAQTPANGSSCTGTKTCTITISVTAGQNVVVATGGYSGAVTGMGVTDTNGDVFTACPAAVSNLGGSFGMFCGTMGTTNASEIFTIQGSAALTQVAAALQAYSGGYTAVDKDPAINASSGTTWSSAASGTTGHASELLVAACYTNSGTVGTQGSGYTMRQTGTNTIWVGLEDRTVSSTGSYTATMTGSNVSYACGIVTLYVPPPTVAAPTFSPSAVPLGFPSTPVTITSATGSAVICYRTDGGTPTAGTPGTCDSPATTLSNGGSVTLGAGATTLTAIGTLSSYVNSSMTSGVYNLYSDQTGSYAFSDNFQNYISPVAAPCYSLGCVNNGQNPMYQLPMDAWNTKGIWTSSGSTSPASSATQVRHDDMIGGNAVALMGNTALPSGSNVQWITYTGATGWNNSGEGQYSKIYYHSVGTYWTSPIACALTFANTSGVATGYALCFSAGSNNYVYLMKYTSGSQSIIATSSAVTLTDGSYIELRTLAGVNQPLLNGSTPAGMNATYTDGSPLTTGNPGVTGFGAYNWSGGTLNASSAPTPISWSGNSYPSYGPFSWNTSSDTSWSTYPWFVYSTVFTEQPILTATVNNSGVTTNGTTVTVQSTLNPGVGAHVVVAGMHPVTMSESGAPYVTTTGSSASSFTYSNSTALPTNSAMSESGTTVTVNNSHASDSNAYGPGQIATIFGASPAGYNGNWTVTGSPSANQFTFTAPPSLGTVTTLGSAIIAGQSSTISSSVYALGAVTSSGIAQNQYQQRFTVGQWIQATINVDTVNSTVRNWFLKLQGNTAILGGAGCYDLVAYYIGVEPMYQSAGAPPNPVSCSGTAEYCGTNWLHITKDTPATSIDPGGGCTGNPNYNVITVSGSNYIPMQNDQILAIYRNTGYLDIYCMGTAHSASAPGGAGCPSTTKFYRVIHVYDSDMLAASWGGNSQGYPGVWAATEANPYYVPMSVFSAVSLGSVGTDTCSVTPSQCIAPVTFPTQSTIF
jgi:hypothetical protein